MLYTLFIGQELGTGLQGLGLKQFAHMQFTMFHEGGTVDVRGQGCA